MILGIQNIHPSILLAIQPWVSLGLLDNQAPLLPILRLLCPLSYLHCPQICYIIIHPSQTRSSFPSSYKQSSFHHPSWHCPIFHSFTWPSYLILCAFMDFTISFPSMNLFSSSLYLILQVPPLVPVRISFSVFTKSDENSLTNSRPIL